MDELELDDYQYVVASDPGGTTGIAMLRYTETTPPELVFLYQQGSGYQGYWEFFSGSQPKDNVVIVSESFEDREGVHGRDFTPLKIEGVQYAIWGDEVVYQSPSMKHLVPDTWLKQQNLWTPGHRHQMDALIHALVYLRNEGHEPTLKALSDAAENPIAQPGEAEEKSLGSVMDELGEATKEAGEGVAKLGNAVQNVMDALAALYGGDEPERTEMPSSGEGEGESGEGGGDGEGDSEAQGEPQEGEPTGDGGWAPVSGGEIKSETGTRRRKLNGAFTGFDD